MNNPFLEAMQHMFDDNGYAPGAGRNIYKIPRNSVCDYPKNDSRSILIGKVIAYGNEHCPFCQSKVSVGYENICAGFGEYYDTLYIRCSCGLSFVIRDDESIDLWNNANRKGVY